MVSKNHWLKPLLSSVGFVLVLAGWLIFAPTNIGGQTSYVILIGNSMEPGFKRGDLVLVREAVSYQSGEIVAYRHPNIGIVFHRIISQKNGRFILKGDNNPREDSDQPTQQDVVGSLWLHLPGAGKYLQYFRTPGIFALSVAGLSLFGGTALFSDDQFALNFKKFNRKHDSNIRKNKVVNMERKIPESLYTVAVIGFAAFLLTLVSFTNPLERIVPDNYEFTHNGRFEYFAEVPQGVYEEDFLQSGDPIFRQLNNSLNILFTYEFDGDRVSKFNGTYRLIAEISEPGGWMRTIEITPLSEFSSQAFTSTGLLGLSRVQELTDYLELQTGISNNRYTLSIKPEVTLMGTMGDRDLVDIYSPELRFSFEDLKLELIKENVESGDPLNSQEFGVITGYETAANTISILGFDLNILIARMIAVYALIGSLIGLVWIGLKYFFFQKNNQFDQIRARYGSLLVDIRGGKYPSSQIIEVENMGELAKIAAMDQSMIYHLNRVNIHHYFVMAANNSDVSYHYQLPSADTVESIRD